MPACFRQQTGSYRHITVNESDFQLLPPAVFHSPEALAAEDIGPDLRHQQEQPTTY